MAAAELGSHVAVVAVEVRLVAVGGAAGASVSYGLASFGSLTRVHAHAA